MHHPIQLVFGNYSSGFLAISKIFYSKTFVHGKVKFGYHLLRALYWTLAYLKKLSLEQNLKLHI